MSPRSQEFFAEARRRLAAAQILRDRDLNSAAVSAAYYAMLYAARAALSERDRFARTHGGTWQLLREEFVFTGELDEEVVREAQRAQSLREKGDYQAEEFSRDEAAELVGAAERFLGDIRRLVGEP